MGKYIVKVTEKKTRAIVVDANNEAEARTLGIEAVRGADSGKE